MNYLLKGLSNFTGASDQRLQRLLRSADSHTRSGRFVADPARPRRTGAQYPQALGHRLASTFRLSNVANGASTRAGVVRVGARRGLLRPGAAVVGLGLRVDAEGRPMKHSLTTIVSDVRLRQIMTELRLPAIAHAGAFDREARQGSDRLRSRLPAPTLPCSITVCRPSTVSRRPDKSAQGCRRGGKMRPPCGSSRDPIERPVQSRYRRALARPEARFHRRTTKPRLFSPWSSRSALSKRAKASCRSIRQFAKHLFKVSFRPSVGSL